ncbi:MULTISPECIES: carbon storage regulator [unclassified Schlesneria]|uniref:carbon storage regulator n=1 Tax=Schlesneria TaxID=656899 RepID=UPI002EFF11B6
MRCYMRAENEGLTVGSVTINVLEVRHDSVLLGIHDPHATPSYREEVLYVQSEDDDVLVEVAHEEFEAIEFQPVNSYAAPL